MRSRLRARSLAQLAGVGLLALVATAGVTVAGAAGGSSSNVVPLSPERILDTRLGTGQPAPGAVGPGQTITLKVAGVGSVPANATGVILNITATRATEASFVTAWPTGQTQPTTSILNFQPGADIANMITATLGANGSINLFNSAGSVDLIADVAGFLTPSGGGGGASGSIVIERTVGTGTPPDTLGSAAGFDLIGNCTVTGFTASIRADDDAVVSFRGTTTRATATSVRAHQDEPFIPLIDNSAIGNVNVLDGLISAPGGIVARVTLAVTHNGSICSYWAQFDPATRASGFPG